MTDAAQQSQLDHMLEKLSHDLRGRLASIMGYAEIILDTGEEAQDLPEDILVSAKAIQEISAQMVARIAEIKDYHGRS